MRAQNHLQQRAWRVLLCVHIQARVSAKQINFRLPKDQRSFSAHRAYRRIALEATMAVMVKRGNIRHSRRARETNRSETEGMMALAVRYRQRRQQLEDAPAVIKDLNS